MNFKLMVRNFFDLYKYVLRQCWRNRTIWGISIRFLSCKKWSKIMKNTLVFLKQPRMDTFSLSEALKIFLGEKIKMTNLQDRNKKSSKQILPQSYFLKMFKFDPFLGFPNFQNQFFLSLLVSHQKNFFSELQNNFCFLKKNLAPYLKYMEN